MKAPKEKEIVIRPKTSTRWVGVYAAAKRLGVTHSHLRRVIVGERISADLSRRMARANIRVDAGKTV